MVARINRYSHVVVYVGRREDKNGKRVVDRNGEEIHDVVHVAKSNWRGIVVAGITKVDINTVVKPNDKVFLGHKLKKCQFAGNVRQKIAERAIACAEKPKLLFAYDHRFKLGTTNLLILSLSSRSNCETFCNMIVFNKPKSTQTEQTTACIRGTTSAIKSFPTEISGVFCCVSCLRCKTLEPLGDQIEKRLAEKDLA